MTAITRKHLRRHKGRQGGDAELFAHLPDEVLRGDAYRTLPHPVRSVLVALTAQFHGHNNGSLTLTRATAVQYGDYRTTGFLSDYSKLKHQPGTAAYSCSDQTANLGKYDKVIIDRIKIYLK